MEADSPLLTGSMMSVIWNWSLEYLSYLLRNDDDDDDDDFNLCKVQPITHHAAMYSKVISILYAKQGES